MNEILSPTFSENILNITGCSDIDKNKIINDLLDGLPNLNKRTFLIHTDPLPASNSFEFKDAVYLDLNDPQIRAMVLNPFHGMSKNMPETYIAIFLKLLEGMLITMASPFGENEAIEKRIIHYAVHNVWDVMGTGGTFENVADQVRSMIGLDSTSNLASNLKVYSDIELSRNYSGLEFGKHFGPLNIVEQGLASKNAEVLLQGALIRILQFSLRGHSKKTVIIINDYDVLNKEGEWFSSFLEAVDFFSIQVVLTNRFL